jgi:hypothetical protein
LNLIFVEDEEAIYGGQRRAVTNASATSMLGLAEKPKRTGVAVTSPTHSNVLMRKLIEGKCCRFSFGN